MVINKNTLSFVILFFFSITMVQGNSRTVPGYIIKSGGDTIYGEIKDLGIKKLTQTCLFRLPDEKSFTEYTPGEVFSFRISTKYYISKEVDIDDKKETIFVEYLVNGIVDLFYLRFNDQFYYLIENEEGNQSYINVNNKYAASNEELAAASLNDTRNKGILKSLMQDYPEIFPKIDQIRFEDNRTMRKLITDYHEGICTEYDCIDYTKSESKSKMYIGLTYGIQSPEMNFYSNHPALDYIADAEAVPPPISSFYGIDFSSTIPSISKQFSIDTRLEFSKESFEYNYESPAAKTSISYNYIALNINFGYNFKIADFLSVKPYIGAGFNYLANYNCNVTTTLDRRNFTLNKFRGNLNAGLAIDILLIKSQKLHIQPAFNYKLALIKEVSDIYANFNYDYNALGASISIIKYIR